jgi:hypothetical protein
LTRIESKAFYQSALQLIEIPPTILFVACNAFGVCSQIKFVDGNSCHEFDQWMDQKRSGIALDFRRIERVGSGLRCLREYVVNLSEFEKRSMISESYEIGKEIYNRIEDDIFIFVKSIPHLESLEHSRIEKELENLINLRHPCIAAPIGFVVRIESGSWEELKIVRMYLEGSSLSEILSVDPMWWTSTIKAKVVSGIVLGLQFVHSLGLIHGNLSTRNILFDSDHCIQIVDFQPIQIGFSEKEGEERTQQRGLSRESWTRAKDIHAFALILLEIVGGRRANGDISIPTDIPEFLSNIIETGLSLTSESNYSFNDILNILKDNKFQIEDSVDLAEISAFVNWVELAEQLEK